jgi:hypothetical protein
VSLKSRDWGAMEPRSVGRGHLDVLLGAEDDGGEKGRADVLVTETVFWVEAWYNAEGQRLSFVGGDDVGKTPWDVSLRGWAGSETVVALGAVSPPCLACGAT